MAVGQNEGKQGLNILVSGMFGEINVGDEAICFAMVKGLRNFFPKPNLSLITFDKNRSRTFTSTRDVDFFEGQCFTHKFWFRLLAFLNHVFKADMIIVGGGGLFQDQYSWHLPAGSALVAALGVVRNIPTFIVGMGVGPVRRSWLKKIMRVVLSSVSGICVRDTESLETLQELGIKNTHIFKTADVVPSIDFREFHTNKEEAVDSNTICIAFRRWPGLDLKKFALLLDELVLTGHTIQLQCYEPDLDAKFYNEVLLFCSEKTILNTEIFIPTSLQDVIDSIIKAKCILSMRLHGCVFAVALNTPLIPIVYERKIRGFIEQIHLEEYLREVEDVSPSLSKEINKITSFWARSQGQIYNQYSKIIKNSCRNFEIIKNRIENCQKIELGQPNKIAICAAISSLLLIGAIFEFARVVSWAFNKLNILRY